MFLSQSERMSSSVLSRALGISFIATVQGAVSRHTPKLMDKMHELK